LHAVVTSGIWRYGNDGPALEYFERYAARFVCDVRGRGVPASGSVETGESSQIMHDTDTCSAGIIVNNGFDGLISVVTLRDRSRQFREAQV
jgi:hypothetical protein